MAYQYTDYSGYGNETEEETRRRRAMLLAGLPEGAGLADVAGQAINNRIGQAQTALTQTGQMLSNPEEELRKRMGVAGPVAPEQVAQAQPQAQQVPEQLPAQGPISPAMAQQAVEQPQLPQPGPAVQVAGPAQVAPQAQPSMAQMGAQAQQPVVTPEQKYNDAIIAAGNETDPIKRRNMFAQIMAKEDVSEGSKTLANRLIAEDYLKQRNIAEAEQKIQNATPNDLSRYMRERTKEGSYVKALLYARLGLNDLAQKEQELLSPTLKMGVALDETGKQFTVERDNTGAIVRGFDSNGKTLNQETLAKLSAGAMPTQAHLLPSTHGSPVQRTNSQGQVETGLMMYDPRTQQTYVQVGNQKLPTTGWTTMAQNVQAVYGAAGAGQQGKQAATTGVQQPALPPLAGMPQFQPASQMQQAPAQAQPAQAMPQAAPQAQPQAQPAAQVTAQASPTGGVKLTPQRAGGVGMGGGATVVQQPGESFSSYEQRKEAAMKQTGANIELRKEVAAAEQKVPAEAKGKVTAKTINEQDTSNRTFPVLREINTILANSTGSGIGAKVDDLARIIGSSPNGAQAIAQLQPLAGRLVSYVPRFEGAQSDRDVIMYQKQAGDFANPELPVKERLAALQGMVKLMKIYDKDNTNDWGSLTPQSQIKIIKREKVQ